MYCVEGTDKPIRLEREDAYEDGRKDGRAEGERKKLIELVEKKIAKEQTVEQIADTLEESVEVRREPPILHAFNFLKQFTHCPYILYIRIRIQLKSKWFAIDYH